MRRAIFVGNGRTDTAEVAARLCDALGFAFGDHLVFSDLTDLPAGADFAAYLKSRLPRCRVFLVLIGPHWIDARNAAGVRCLDDPDDPVRIEIKLALATPGLLVAPVLIDGARMPTAEELPKPLRRFARRRAAAMDRDPDLRTDIARLVEALRAHLRTGRLNLRSLGGPASVPANVDWTSGLASAGWFLAIAAATAVGASLPDVRGPAIRAGAAIVEATQRQLASARSETQHPAPIEIAEAWEAPPANPAPAASQTDTEVELVQLSESDGALEDTRQLDEQLLGEQQALVGVERRPAAESHRGAGRVAASGYAINAYPEAVRASVQSAEAAEQAAAQAAGRARNRQSGTAVVDFGDGTQWEGQVDTNGNPTGAGVYTTERARYYGQWSQGGAHGYGVLYERIAYDAKRYAGEWRSGLRGGIGAAYWAGDNAVVCAGLWEGARLITAIGPQADTTTCP